MNLLANMFKDQVFGKLLRFVFDRLFGSFFQNDVNFNNVDLRNCHFRDLTFNADKINDKFFKQTPFRFFNGSIKNFQIRLPPLSNLITESIEILIDGLDLMIAFDSVDYSKIDRVARESQQQEANKDAADVGNEELQAVEKEMDIYKKIINRILLNMKIRVTNTCIRVLSEKPIKQDKIVLPHAPCLLFKIGFVSLKKILVNDSKAKEGEKSEQNKDELGDSMIFSKINNYYIEIKQVSAHMLTQPEIHPSEYSDMTPSKCSADAEFPFEYPTHSHPSTFLAFGFGVKENKKGLYPSFKNQQIPEGNGNDAGVEMHLILTSNRSKEIDIRLPAIEIMLDFIVIKYMSRYVEKAIEWQKATDYLNFKKQQYQNSEEYNSKRKNSEVVVGLRKTSEDLSSRARVRKMSEISATMAKDKGVRGGKHVTIGGYDLDVNYFESLNQKAKEGEESKQPEEVQKTSENQTSELLEELKKKGLSMEALDAAPDLADHLLDSSNLEIRINLAGIYFYALKTSSTFLRTEFKRRWMFDEAGSRESFHKFNLKIPVDYFLLKLKKLSISGRKVDNHTELSVTFSNFKLLDVLKVDRPLRTQNIHASFAKPTATLNQQNMYGNLNISSSELFHSIIPSSNLIEQSLRLSKKLSRGASHFQQQQQHEAMSKLSVNKNILDGSSILYASARDYITEEFLQIRKNETKKIVDFVLDDTREHFSVNYLFKFNTNSKTYKKQCRIVDEKNAAYTIYQPFNTPAFENYRSAEHIPNLKFSFKTGEVSATMSFPPFYSSFYIKVIVDILAILHNSSDGYFIIEKQYEEFRNTHWNKWADEFQLSHGNKSNLKEFDKKEIDEAVEEYRNSQIPPKIQITAEFDFGRIVLLGEHEIDLTNKSSNLNDSVGNTRSFEGTIMQFFEEPQSPTEWSWENHTIFSKKALILDIAKVMGKFKKGYEPFETVQSVKAHVLFEEMNLYYPYKIEKETKKIKVSKLFWLSARNLKTKEGNYAMVVPSIEFQTAKPDFEQEDIDLAEKPKEKVIIRVEEDELEEFMREDSAKLGPSKFNMKGTQDEDNLEKDGQSLEWLAKQSEDFNEVYHRYQAFRSKASIEQKETYFKECEALAAKQVKITVPIIEVYLSNHSINFLAEFATRTSWYFDQINEQLREVLSREAQFFETYLGREKSIKKPKKLKEASYVSVKISELNVLLFEPQTTKSAHKATVPIQTALRPDLGRLEDSILDSSVDMSNFKPINKVYEDATLEFERKEFDHLTKNFLCVALKNLHTVILVSPLQQFQAIHCDLSNIYVSDKKQLQPEYGSHILRHMKEKKGSAQSLKSPEFEGECDQQIILYNQCFNDQEALNCIKYAQEIEFLSDLKLPDVQIFSHDYTIFENTASNVCSFAALIANNTKTSQPTNIVEASLRVSKLVLRSDLEFKFIDSLQPLLKIAPESIYKKPSENKAPGSDNILNPEKPKVERYTSLEFELNELMVDILPYTDYQYYLDKGLKLLDLKHSELDIKSTENIYYTNYRILLALRTLNFNTKLSSEGFSMGKFELMNLDLFLRNSLTQSPKKTPIILRSEKPKGNLFDSGFDELRTLYDFKSNPFRLGALALSYSKRPEENLEIATRTLEIPLCADTILTLIRANDVISYQLNVGRNRRLAAGQQEMKNQKPKNPSQPAFGTIDEEPELKPQKPHPQMSINDEIELDLDFYRRKKVLPPIRETDDGFDIIEDEYDSNVPVVRAGDIEEEEKGGLDRSMKESMISASMSTKSQNSFISSNTVKFDEENMHTFYVDKQKIRLKVELKIESLQIRIQQGRDFDIEASNYLTPVNNELDREEIKEITIGPRVEEERGGMMISLENLTFSAYIMHPNPDLRTNATFRVALSCEQFEVIDLFDKKLSKINKMLTKHRSTQNMERIKNDSKKLIKYRLENKTTIFNFLDVILEVISIKGSTCQDIRLFVGIHPIQINFNIQHYNFLKEFSKQLTGTSTENISTADPSMGQSMGERSPEIKRSVRVEKKPVKTDQKKAQFFIPLAQISNFDVYLNIDLDLKIFNLEGFKDAKFEFKRLTLRAVHDLDKLFAKIKEYYSKSITTQVMQLGTVLNLPIARNLSNLVSATFNMIYLPYEHFKEDKGITSGLKEGVSGFAKSVATEGLSLTEFMTNTVANLISLTGNSLLSRLKRLTLIIFT